jgi:hypothetical protein
MELPMSQTATPMTPEQELTWVHRKRQQFLDQLELKVMTDEKTPVSLLSLYRNTLRDHEAACYKMLEATSRDPKTAPPVTNGPALPKGKSMVSSCLAWFAAMLALLFCSSAHAMPTKDCDLTEAGYTQVSYTSALRLDARQSKVQTCRETTAPRTPLASD